MARREYNESVFKEMESLLKDILHHARIYFEEDRQQIPNHVYDEMVLRYEELAEARPDLAELLEVQNKPIPFHSPGLSELKLHPFDKPFLGIKRDYTLEGLCVGGEPLFDPANPSKQNPALNLFYNPLGVPVEVTYVDHTLTRLVTQGTGTIGEDVSTAIPLFWDLPPTLPSHLPNPFTLRGVATVSYDNLSFFNELAPSPANSPRNAVSRWIRCSVADNDLSLRGVLRFFVLEGEDTFDCVSLSQLRDVWQALGFSIPFTVPVSGLVHEKLISNYPVDGIVIAVDKFTNDEIPTNTATIYSFQPESVDLVPTTVGWETTGSGRVVPSVYFPPLTLNDTSVQRATIGDYRTFMDLSLRSDSVVSICREGDFIPAVQSVVSEGNGVTFKAPEKCSDCGSILQLRVAKNSADLYCVNTAVCPAQLANRCLQLASPQCLDIKELNPIQIGQLISDGIIQQTSDIFTRLDSMNASDRLLSRIEEVRHQPLYQVINTLGLPGVNRTVAIRLAEHCPKDPVVAEGLVRWLGDLDKVIDVPGVSTGTAFDISSTLDDDDVASNAISLIANFTIDRETVVQEVITRVVISGELGHPAKELEDYFVNHGVEIQKRVTEETEFLILGEKPSKSKMLKATELGIVILSSATFASIDAIIAHLIGEKLNG